MKVRLWAKLFYINVMYLLVLNLIKALIIIIIIIMLNLTFKKKLGEKSHSVQENDNYKNMPKLGKISQNMPIIE